MGGGETEDGTLGDHTMGGGPRDPESGLIYTCVYVCVHVYNQKKNIHNMHRSILAPSSTLCAAHPALMSLPLQCFLHSLTSSAL